MGSLWCQCEIEFHLGFTGLVQKERWAIPVVQGVANLSISLFYPSARVQGQVDIKSKRNLHYT